MKVKPGAIDHNAWHIVDIMPTVLDAVGAKRPDKDAKGRPIPAADGVSVLSVLRGGPAPDRGPLCFEHKGNWAIIDGNWKLVGEVKEKEGGHTVTLYDYQRDRAESSDIAPKHPEKVKELRAEWEKWATRVEANDMRK
jgi:arylsulfatase